MKKFMAALLSVIMLFCFSAPFFAESEAVNYKEDTEAVLINWMKKNPKLLKEPVKDYEKLNIIAYPLFCMDVLKANDGYDYDSISDVRANPETVYCAVYQGGKVILERAVNIKDRFVYERKRFDSYMINPAEGIGLLKEKFGTSDVEITLFANPEGCYAAVSADGNKMYRVGTGYFGDETIPLVGKKYSYRELFKASERLCARLDEDLQSGKFDIVCSPDIYHIDDFIKLPMSLWIYVAVGALLVLCAVVVIIRVKRNKKR